MIDVAPNQIFAELVKPATRPDPYPLWRQLADHGPAFQDNGVCLVPGYADCVALFQDPRVSSDASKVTDEPQAPIAAPFFLMDPPDHGRLRRLTMKHFGPPDRGNYVDSLTGDIRGFVQRFIDELKGETRFDLIPTFANRLPVEVIAKITGISVAEQDPIGRWLASIIFEPESLKLLDTDGAMHREQAKSAEALGGFLMKTLTDRKQNPRGDDILNRLLADDAADAMSDEEVVSTMMILLAGGHETTITLIGNAMVQLLRHPDTMTKVRADSRLVAPLVEEVLRFEPPIQYRVRYALDELEIAGVKVPAGTKLMPAIAAANRDAAMFANPDRFDIHRAPHPHLSFASGSHFCFGAPLARLEGQIALGELVRRLRNPRLIEEELAYKPSPETRGPKRLVIEVDGFDD
ncbi:cytochrome P450 [Variovorax sp. LT2P21]|uniref:cytochrome P450 n=1 Tax=Variovorax sp. LT2P21 TaxID=3443731 RepID=UPI003F47E706